MGRNEVDESGRVVLVPDGLSGLLFVDVDLAYWRAEVSAPDRPELVERAVRVQAGPDTVRRAMLELALQCSRWNRQQVLWKYWVAE